MGDEEVKEALATLGITMDDSQEDRHRFATLMEIMAHYGQQIHESYLEVNIGGNSDNLHEWWLEDAQEWLMEG